MSDNLDWTQDLGDAVLAQEGELTDTIQRLRGEADKVGALESNEQQRVEKAGDTIVIQPAQPEVVYVPSYDPVKVYGDTSPPPKQYYPDAYADSSASYDAGYAAGRAAGESATSYVPGGTVVPAESVYPGATTTVSGGGDSTSEWVSFGVGALAGGLLTAAIMWDDDDDWNDRIYYGGPGYYGAPSYWSQPSYWNNNGWRQPSNVYVDRTRNIDVDRTMQRGDVTQVRREGAASGKLGDLKGQAGAGGKGADLKDRASAAGGARAKAPEARAKAQAKAPAAKAKPKVQSAAAAKRPVDREAKRPAVSEVARPAKTASRPQAQRSAATRAAAPKTSAFKQASKSSTARAASNRGGASRAKAANRGGGGAGRGGGGRARGR